MSENQTETKAKNTKSKCLKIVTTPDHDIERVRRILLKFNPEYIILESKTRNCNYKTLHIAQALKKEGCKDVGMKFYKGDLLKVQMSINWTAETKVSSACSRVNTGDHPADYRKVAGATMSDIDHKRVG